LIKDLGQDPSLFILRRKKELEEERRSKFEKIGLNIIFVVNNTYAKDGAH